MTTDSKSLFEWKAPSSQFVQRLILASIASLTIHILCFYIFQVQEPKARRTLPQTHRAIALTPQDEAARTRLRQLEDYHAAYSGTLLAGSSLEMPPPRLDYQPTYQTTKVQLMPLPDLEPSAPEAREVLAVSPLMLPAIPAWTPPEGAVEQAQVPSATETLSEGLNIVLPKVWQERMKDPGTRADWKALRASLGADEGSSRWRVAIGPAGTISQIFPMTESPKSEIKEALKSLTFSPPQGNVTTWFQVQVTIE